MKRTKGDALATRKCKHFPDRSGSGDWYPGFHPHLPHPPHLETRFSCSQLDSVQKNTFVRTHPASGLLPFAKQASLLLGEDALAPPEKLPLGPFGAAFSPFKTQTLTVQHSAPRGACNSYRSPHPVPSTSCIIKGKSSDPS